MNLAKLKDKRLIQKSVVFLYTNLEISKSERKISLLKEMKAVTQSNNENSAWD